MPSRSAVALAVNSGMVKCFIYFNVDVNDDDNFFLPLFYVREYPVWKEAVDRYL